MRCVPAVWQIIGCRRGQQELLWVGQAGRAPRRQPSRTALGHQQIRFPHLHQALLTVLACVGPWQKSPFSAPLRLNSGPDQEPELHLLRCLRARGAPPSPPLRPARAEACAAMLWSALPRSTSGRFGDIGCIHDPACCPPCSTVPQASRGGGTINISNAPSGVPRRDRPVVWKPPQRGVLRPRLLAFPPSLQGLCTLLLTRACRALR